MFLFYFYFHSYDIVVIVFDSGTTAWCVSYDNEDNDTARRCKLTTSPLNVFFFKRRCRRDDDIATEVQTNHIHLTKLFIHRDNHELKLIIIILHVVLHYYYGAVFFLVLEIIVVIVVVNKYCCQSSQLENY